MTNINLHSFYIQLKFYALRVTCPRIAHSKYKKVSPADKENICF